MQPEPFIYAALFIFFGLLKTVPKAFMEPLTAPKWGGSGLSLEELCQFKTLICHPFCGCSLILSRLRLAGRSTLITAAPGQLPWMGPTPIAFPLLPSTRCQEQREVMLWHLFYRKTSKDFFQSCNYFKNVCAVKTVKNVCLASINVIKKKKSISDVVNEKRESIKDK